MRDIVITSSVLILTVLLIRYFAKGRLAPALQYALWLPVALRLLLPIPLWNSSFSVLNLIPDGQITDEMMIEKDSPAAETEKAGNLTEPAAGVAAGNTAEAEAAGIAADVNGSGNPQGGQEGHFAQSDRGFHLQGQAPETVTVPPEKLFSLAGSLPYIWAAGMVLVGGYMLFYQIRWQKYLRVNRKPFAKQRK
ncbi:MAG: hypothetical protein HDR27_03100, partial [Lachnospiraceae bacterium]|nr:hypothetical protein [Lachnospiraceae bacterium]